MSNTDDAKWNWTGYKEEVILNYDDFKTRIPQVEDERKQNPHHPHIYVIFSGSYVGSKSWCGLCNSVHDFISREIVKAHPNPNERAFLLWVRVGTEKEFATRSNPFRSDPQISLKSLPGIYHWGTDRRLVGFEASHGELIKDLFGFQI